MDLIINFTEPTNKPVNGYVVRYRTRNNNVFGNYVTVSPNQTSSPIIISNVQEGVSYEGDIKSECSGLLITFTACGCATGFTKKVGEDKCQKIETTAPNIYQSDYCLAPSKDVVYGVLFSRIYNSNFQNEDIAMDVANPSHVFAEMHTPHLWKNILNTANDGPVNRAAVWIDSDCDGIKDELANGIAATIAYNYNNSGAERVIYVGIAADNSFTLKVNDVVVAQTLSPFSSQNFYIWHIFPVTLRKGINNFNAIAFGDGSINDAIGMEIYDTTRENLVSANTYESLPVIFTTASLIGNRIDIANCEVGWTLDTSGGQGNYVCTRTTIQNCV